MKNKDQNTPDKKITDLHIQRIRKNVIEETDPDYREEVEDFLKKYRDDTLTGL